MYKNILLAIDIGDEATWKSALPTAISYCHAFGSTLRIMTVLPDFGMSIVSQFFPQNFDKKAMKEAENELRSFKEKHVPDDIESAIALGQGSIPEQVLKVQKKAKCDLVIMHARHPSAEDMMVKPNATAVMRNATCSVLVVRD